MKLMSPSSITLTSSNISDSAYTAWNSATSYSIGNKVYVASTYGEYEARVANTNVEPSTHVYDATTNPEGEWIFLGTTNKYKMFDQFLNTQSVKNGKIEVEIVAYGSNGIYLGNLVCNKVTIEVVDNDSLDIIESAYYVMYRDILDWQDYFYGTWIEDKKDSIFYERTTLSKNISYLITIDNGASDAKCGICYIGTIKDIGQTKFNVNVGALDYSTVAINISTGATYLSKGNYAKTMSVDIFTPTSQSSAVYKALISARGTPVVFIGGVYELITVYGYIQKFEEVLAGAVETAITVDIVGLI